MIYVLRTRGAKPSFIKIGYCKESLYSRVKKLQTGCPFKLDVIAFFDGDMRDEKEIHRKLSGRRIRGEWYKDGMETFLLIGVPFSSQAKRGVDVPGWPKNEPGKVSKANWN